MVRQFLDYLRLEKHFSEYTVKSYGADLVQFGQFLAGEIGQPVGGNASAEPRVPMTPEQVDEKRVVHDAYGNVLQDGDAVTVIKDLKVKGSSSVVKVGTKVKSIRLVDGDHDIDCKIDGIGAMQLKSEFVKKA